MYLSLLLGKKTNGNFVLNFIRFCNYLKRAFCKNSPISTERNGRLKPRKFLNRNRKIGNKAQYSGSSIFKRWVFLLTHPAEKILQAMEYKHGSTKSHACTPCSQSIGLMHFPFFFAEIPGKPEKFPLLKFIASKVLDGLE